MRQVHNPFGGVNPLIDKMIGNAYDIVKYVARYLKEIRYVAENMEHVYNVAHGFKRTVELQSNGRELFVALPQGVDIYNLEGVHVIAEKDGQLYFPSPSTFDFGVSGGQLVISISEFLSYSIFTCTFIYTPSE